MNCFDHRPDQPVAYPFANPDQFAEQIQRQMADLSLMRSSKR